VAVQVSGTGAEPDANPGEETVGYDLRPRSLPSLKEEPEEEASPKHRLENAFSIISFVKKTVTIHRLLA
jgi:hypothetical protein